MKVSRLIISLMSVLIWLFLPCSASFNSGLADGNTTAPKAQPLSAPGPGFKRSAGSDASIPAEKSQELLEKESALSVKEQELKKMSTRMDAQIKELDTAKKAIEGSLAAKKKLDTERYKKMMKLYKALRPEEAAKLLDKLDEDIAFEMLNQMDQKTTAKLIPLLNQARILRWTRLTLKGK